MRLVGVLWMAALAAVSPCALSSAARAQDASVPEQIIEAMHQLWGQHPGLRANHAKGIVVQGSFTPTEAGARLSRAPLFRGGSVPVIARFSDPTGIPDVADGSARARPNGLAIRFGPVDNGQMDLVLNTLPFFPVATGEEFRDMLRAAAASGPGSPKPTASDRFGESHPAAPRAAAAVRTPSSLARATYNGLNAFIFVDSVGTRRPFRVRMVPVDGVDLLSNEDAAQRPANFLMEELPARLTQRPVQFRFMAQLAKPGDQTKDATQPWPDDREVVDLGIVTFTAPAADGEKIARETVFMPTNLPDGIEPSDDPLIDTRVQAYAISFGLRSQ
jgi:catalase